LVNPNTPEIKENAVYALAKSADAIFAARASGLYRSRDQGYTWQNTFDSLNKAESLTAAAVVAEDQTVFVGAKGAILRSDDAGESWHLVALSSPPPLVTALALSPNFRQDGTVIAGTAEDGVFVSTDRGASWTAWNFGLIDFSIYTLVISPNFEKDRTVFIGTECGVFRSHNNGRSWRETSFPMESAPVLSIAMSAGYLYAGTEASGLFISDDFGLTWHTHISSLISTSINAIHADDALDPNLYLLLDDRLVHSNDSAASWITQQIFTADQMPMTMLPMQAGILVGFADGQMVYVR